MPESIGNPIENILGAENLQHEIGIDASSVSLDADATVAIDVANDVGQGVGPVKMARCFESEAFVWPDAIVLVKICNDDRTPNDEGATWPATNVCSGMRQGAIESYVGIQSFKMALVFDGKMNGYATFGAVDTAISSNESGPIRREWVNHGEKLFVPFVPPMRHQVGHGKMVGSQSKIASGMKLNSDGCTPRQQMHELANGNLSIVGAQNGILFGSPAAPVTVILDSLHGSNYMTLGGKSQIHEVLP